MAFGLCRSGRRGLRDVIDDATMNALFYLEAKLISMNVLYIVLCRLHGSFQSITMSASVIQKESYHVDDSDQ